MIINAVDFNDRMDDLLPEVPSKPSYALAENFKVYTNGNVVVNWPYPGFDERTLKTINDYQGEDGGYVAIYTRNQEKGIYGVGGGIYVMGQIRVQGHYEGRIFLPTGYQRGDDITRDREILKKCAEHFPDMGEDMWVGGDTGGWFGIQQ